MRQIFLVLWICLSMTTLCFSSEIVLKSGQKLQGKIVEKTEQYIKFDSGIGMSVTYYMDEISSLDGQEVQTLAPAAKVSQPSVEAPIVTASKILPKEEVSAPKEEAIPQSPMEPVSMVIADQANPIVFPSQSSADTNTTTQKKIFKKSTNMKLNGKFPVALGFGILVAILLFVVLFYFLFTFPRYKIALKLNTQPAWLAWIPLVHYYLMCKMANRPYWILLVYGLVFIPFIGIIFAIISLFVTIYIWVGIIKALGRPAWMGVLIIVPLVNLIFIWYLALSTESKV